MCTHDEETGSCCKCFPYRTINAICPPVTTSLLVITSVFAIFLIARFPFVAFMAGIFSLVAWMLFMSSCCCMQSQCGMITTGVFGCVSAFFTFLLALRLRKPLIDLDGVFCEALNSGSDSSSSSSTGYTNDNYYYYNVNRNNGIDDVDCEGRRKTMSRIYMFVTFVWIVASIHLFVFACCLYPRQYGKKKNKDDEDDKNNSNKGLSEEALTAQKLGALEAGQMVAPAPVLHTLPNGQQVLVTPQHHYQTAVPVAGVSIPATNQTMGMRGLPLPTHIEDSTEQSETVSSSWQDSAVSALTTEETAGTGASSKPKKSKKKKKSSSSSHKSGDESEYSSSTATMTQSKKSDTMGAVVTEEEIRAYAEAIRGHGDDDTDDKPKKSSSSKKKKKKKKRYDENGNEIKRPKMYDEDGNEIKRKKKKKKKKPEADMEESDYSESDYTDSEGAYGEDGAGASLKATLPPMMDDGEIEHDV